MTNLATFIVMHGWMGMTTMSELTLEDRLESMQDYLRRDGDEAGSEAAYRARLLIASLREDIITLEEIINEIPQTIYENICERLEIDLED